MFLLKSRDLPATAAGSPTSLLEHLAGEFAARVAGVWPKPHLGFLSAPAARRQLVCLALAAGGPADASLSRLLERPLRAAITQAAPSPPTGLARALSHMGEQAWRAEAYVQLLDLLAIAPCAKLLRHRDRLDETEILALAALPRAMLGPHLAQWGLGLPAAQLIGEAFSAIAGRDGEIAAEDAARRWSEAASAEQLTKLVSEDLEGQLAPPPFAGTQRLRPLRTRAAVIDAALRYKNCLRSQAHRAVSGRSAFYEWVEPPNAMVEITRDLAFGWVLDQARLASNKPVPEPTRAAIRQELTAMGVHVGRSFWQIDSLLDDVGRTPLSPVQSAEAMIGELFGD